MRSSSKMAPRSMAGHLQGVEAAASIRTRRLQEKKKAAAPAAGAVERTDRLTKM